jgi:hypothetical protein
MVGARKRGSMSRFIALSIVSILLPALMAVDGFCQGTSRQMMNLQGRAYNQAPTPVALNGNYNMVFSIWDTGPGLGGVQLFTETQNNTPINNGFYNVMLGNVTVDGIPVAVFQNNNLWLQIQIGAETLTPRTRILSASFAFNADQLDGVEGTSLFRQNGNAFGVLGTLGTNDNNALAFETNNIERMRILSDGNVGIASTAPEFKLTIDQGAGSPDGGILSIGAVGTGNFLLVAGSGTRMIWYPRRAAFRAGYVSGIQWNDSNIGDYSTAFGSSNSASGNSSTAFGASTTAGRQRHLCHRARAVHDFQRWQLCGAGVQYHRQRHGFLRRWAVRDCGSRRQHYRAWAGRGQRQPPRQQHRFVPHGRV